MELPALLPPDLAYTAVATTDRNLFNMLLKIPQDFLVFFEHACEDETWCESHQKFLKEAIQWMTNQFFQDRLLLDFAKRAISSIRKHYAFLERCIPKNLLVTFNDHDVAVNGLLWGGSSEFLRTLIRQECRDKNSSCLQLNDLSLEVFQGIEEFINTGMVKELWRKREEEVVELLVQASEWEIADLTEFCQELLKRYISQGNVIPLLLRAHKNRWEYLKNACIEYINQLHMGARLQKTAPDFLAFEFLDFSEKAMNFFEHLRVHITHLICSGTLTEQRDFNEVIHKCPKIICLDISRSNSFNERLLHIPNTIEELDLSECEWLSNRTLKSIVEICPNLTKIKVASNTQLTFSAWAILKDFKHLEKLDLSNCIQIKDDDFKLILQACRNLTHLTLFGCKGLSDHAFFLLGQLTPRLRELDASKCSITDEGLSDLTIRCKQLSVLTLSRCQNITETGILNAVQNGTNLKLLNVEKCPVSQTIVSLIYERRPFLKLQY